MAAGFGSHLGRNVVLVEVNESVEELGVGEQFFGGSPVVLHHLAAAARVGDAVRLQALTTGTRGKR